VIDDNGLCAKGLDGPKGWDTNWLFTVWKVFCGVFEGCGVTNFIGFLGDKFSGVGPKGLEGHVIWKNVQDKLLVKVDSLKSAKRVHLFLLLPGVLSLSMVLVYQDRLIGT
jgi:hypothetical protein